MNDNNLPTLHIPKGTVMLPDVDQWQFRFPVRSETSERLYIISQNKKKGHWGCSCPGYRIYRSCKHLTAVGLPGHEQPFEPRIIKEDY